MGCRVEPRQEGVNGGQVSSYKDHETSVKRFCVRPGVYRFVAETLPVDGYADGEGWGSGTYSIEVYVPLSNNRTRRKCTPIFERETNSVLAL